MTFVDPVRLICFLGRRSGEWRVGRGAGSVFRAEKSWRKRL